MYIEIQCSLETIQVVYKLSDALTRKSEYDESVQTSYRFPD